MRSRFLGVVGPRRETDTGTHAAGRDQDDPCLLKGTRDLRRGSAAQVVAPLLEVADGRAGDAGHVGEVFLGPVQETASSTALRGGERMRHGLRLGVASTKVHQPYWLM